jgi:hypothetical protein
MSKVLIPVLPGDALTFSQSSSLSLMGTSKLPGSQIGRCPMLVLQVRWDDANLCGPDAARVGNILRCEITSRLTSQLLFLSLFSSCQ